jgi:hypothetical protein
MVLVVLQLASTTVHASDAATAACVHLHHAAAR